MKKSIFNKIILLLLFNISNNVNAYDNPYPTLAITEYVTVCMASNQKIFTALQACSCSIDIIAQAMQYDKYVELETIMRLQQMSGEKTLIYKTARYRKKLDLLHNAQIKANNQCFTNRSKITNF